MAATQAPNKPDTKSKDTQASEQEKTPAEKPASQEAAQAHTLTATQRKALGTKLREARVSKGVSQSVMAEKHLVNPKSGAPWHYTYVGNAERGTTAPSQDFVQAIAEFAGVSVESLLPDGVKLSDLTEGVERAPRGSKQKARGRRTQAQPSPNGSGDGQRRRAPSTTTVGISSDGEQVTITFGEARVTLGGQFDASISGGKLHVG